MSLSCEGPKQPKPHATHGAWGGQAAHITQDSPRVGGRKEGGEASKAGPAGPGAHQPARSLFPPPLLLRLLLCGGQAGGRGTDLGIPSLRPLALAWLPLAIRLLQQPLAQLLERGLLGRWEAESSVRGR